MRKETQHGGSEMNPVVVNAIVRAKCLSDGGPLIETVFTNSIGETCSQKDCPMDAASLKRDIDRCPTMGFVSQNRIR